MDFARALLYSISALILATVAVPAAAIDVDRPDVRRFIDAMVSEHDYDEAVLADVLADAESQQAILDAISRPAEKTLAWHEYRGIFLKPERIAAGAEFWRTHAADLERISGETGVAIDILVGIIGVETYFGRITGNYRVLDALATLAFDYPPRSRFFTRELEEFLLLVREEGMDATTPTGSYAGAMGAPQFMPSSYRAYAVDATADGKRDIWTNWTDVIGSVANYFVAHDWRQGEDVVAGASLGQDFAGSVPDNALKPTDTVGGLAGRGVEFETELPPDAPAQLITLEAEDGARHWVGFHNFYVITRYNRSVMYALAVSELGREIAREVADGDT